MFIHCCRAKRLKEMGSQKHEEEIYATVEAFIRTLLPNAIKLRMFNGQFVYQVPL